MFVLWLRPKTNWPDLNSITHVQRKKTTNGSGIVGRSPVLRIIRLLCLNAVGWLSKESWTLPNTSDSNKENFFSNAPRDEATRSRTACVVSCPGDPGIIHYFKKKKKKEDDASALPVRKYLSSANLCQWRHGPIASFRDDKTGTWWYSSVLWRTRWDFLVFCQTVTHKKCCEKLRSCLLIRDKVEISIRNKKKHRHNWQNLIVDNDAVDKKHLYTTLYFNTQLVFHT